jgi:glycosyltransferase involved in cell wall biosynthesis
LLSFIIPTFREAAFGKSLDELVEFLLTIGPRAMEILVVDDSDAAMQEALRATIEQRALRLPTWITARLIAGPRRGKGAAVRLAAQRSRGDIVFVVDADLPVPLRYIAEFVDAIETTHAEVVVGERPRDRYAGDALRRFVAGSLRLIQQGLVFHGAAFEDTQCGFKAFRGNTLRSLVDKQIVDGGMYDLEYLYAATLRNLDVRRIDVAINAESRPSRINVWRCILYDPMDIVRFKVAGSLGRYGK